MQRAARCRSRHDTGHRRVTIDPNFYAVRESTHRLRWLARILYPEQFPEDPAPIVKEFYTLFYHQPPTGQQIAALLAGADPRRR